MKLTHITLQTGQGSTTQLSDVLAEDLARLVPMVQAGRGEVAGYTFEFPDGLVREQGVAGFVLAHPSATSMTLGQHEDAVVHCLLCWSAAAHRDFWPECRQALPAGMPVVEPEPPWLAITFFPLGLIAMTLREPRLLSRMVHVERAIAWAALLELGLAPPGPEAA